MVGVRGEGQKTSKTALVRHSLQQSPPTAWVRGVFHQEARTVPLSFFTLCPKMQKCQKCARVLATKGQCPSPPLSISCLGRSVGVKTTARTVRTCGPALLGHMLAVGTGRCSVLLGPGFMICKMGVEMPGPELSYST